MSDRELLKQARRCIDPGAMPSPEYMSFCECTLKQIDARLSQPDWIRVEDALPVVPEDGAVNLWVAMHIDSSEPVVIGHRWSRLTWTFPPTVTHWRYAEPTPQPPKDKP